MSRKKKVSDEVLQLISKCARREISESEAARKANVGHTTMEQWVMQYTSEGIAAFTYEHNNSYSKELKLAAITDYLSGKGSLVDICAKYKIRDKKLLRDWIKVYNGNGNLERVKSSGGGSYMKNGRDTTQEERVQIAKDCIASGKNYGKTAIKHNISYQQARTWTLKFEKLGAAGLEDRRGKRKKDQAPRTELEEAQIEIERLKHQLYMAEMERDLLKKLEEIERREAYRK